MCEQAIRYPTDLSLLNEAREFSEQIIDKLYPRTELKKKPRSYRVKARKAYLAIAKDFELGIIAGTGTTNPFMSAMLPDADDGKVTVARTQIDGMDDFKIVSNSHFGMMKSDDVIAHATRFLITGSFQELRRSLING